MRGRVVQTTMRQIRVLFETVIFSSADRFCLQRAGVQVGILSHGMGEHGTTWS